MAIDTNVSPFIQWEENPDGTRKTTQVTNEEIKIVNNKAILNWKPSKYDRVTLSSIVIKNSTVDFVEIDLSEEITTIDKFKVNYDNGIIYFHENLDGFTLNVSTYFSEGQILYHVSRIFYKSSDDVIHTLDEILNTLTEMSNTLQLVGLKILDIYATKTELETAHPIGNIGDMYAVGTITNNVVYVWSQESERWFSIGTLKGDKGDTGLKGDKGDTGINGQNGQDGLTPNITIGSVITGEAGSQASASITGTTPNLVLNLTIPKGDTGSGGGQLSPSGEESIVVADPLPRDADTLNGQLPSYYAKATDIPTIVNGLTEIVKGKALDATQGKVLNDAITQLNADLNVLDNDRGYLLSKNISSTLLDTIKRSGKYVCNTIINNLSDWFYIDITSSDNIDTICTQRAISVNLNRIFNRVYTNNSWSPWQEIATTETAELTLLNGWVNKFGSVAKVSKSGKVVTLSGCIGDGIRTENTILFNLPIEYRPINTIYAPITRLEVIDTTLVPRISILITGDVIITNVGVSGDLIFNCSYSV